MTNFITFKINNNLKIAIKESSILSFQTLTKTHKQRLNFGSKNDFGYLSLTQGIHLILDLESILEVEKTSLKNIVVLLNNKKIAFIVEVVESITPIHEDNIFDSLVSNDHFDKYFKNSSHEVIPIFDIDLLL